jgi:hypothetical protein
LVRDVMSTEQRTFSEQAVVLRYQIRLLCEGSR